MAVTPTYYDLTLAQDLLLYSQKFSLFKQLNNVFSLVLLERTFDEPKLRQAINIGYAHCDAMRLRLFKIKGKMKQQFLTEDPPTIGMLDFTGRSEAEMETELKRLAAITITRKNKPLSRIFIVKSWDGKQGIYLGVSHLIMDSWSICVFLKYVLDVYESLNSGRTMPTPLKDYESMLVKDLAYVGSPQYEKDREFWEEECKRPEPFFTDVAGPAWLEKWRRRKHDPNLRHGTTVTLRTRAAHEVIMIPPEQVKQMEEFCVEHKYPMQTLLMMGIRTSLAARNGRPEDITLYNAVARRGTQHEKRSGGTRIHVLIVRNIIPESCTFLDAVAQITERQSLMFRHAEFSFMELLSMLQDAYCHGNRMSGYCAMSLTFQPVPMTLDDGTKIYTRWIGNGVASQPIYITVMDGDGTGALRVYYEYQTARFDVPAVRAFHDEVMKVVLTGVANPAITSGELIDLIQKPAQA